MKILHTADVHLHTEHPRRLEALQEAGQSGPEENIDLLLIAGDLFDDHQQAELLRGETRRLFSNLPYKVLAIPGNHDERAFSQDSFWGADFSALPNSLVPSRISAPGALWQCPIPPAASPPWPRPSRKGRPRQDECPPAALLLVAAPLHR